MKTLSFYEMVNAVCLWNADRMRFKHSDSIRIYTDKLTFRASAQDGNIVFSFDDIVNSDFGYHSTHYFFRNIIENKTMNPNNLSENEIFKRFLTALENTEPEQNFTKFCDSLESLFTKILTEN